MLAAAVLLMAPPGLAWQLVALMMRREEKLIQSGPVRVEPEGARARGAARCKGFNLILILSLLSGRSYDERPDWEFVSEIKCATAGSGQACQPAGQIGISG